MGQGEIPLKQWKVIPYIGSEKCSTCLMYWHDAPALFAAGADEPERFFCRRHAENLRQMIRDVGGNPNAEMS